jgi:hypothetical protein
MTSYQPALLFTFEAFHSYFTDGVCYCLDFQPGTDTALLQKRFGFPVRDTRNGFWFYQSQESDTAKLLQYIKDNTGISSFDFTINTTTASFYNFTSLPPAWKGQLQYDSRYTVQQPDKKVIELKEQLSGIEDTSITGTVRIWFDDIITQLKKNIPLQYEIRFNARSTQWNYYFINNSGVTLNYPAINNDQGFVFDGPETVTIPSGQKALFFTSGSQLLTLGERPPYRFSLVSKAAQQAGKNKLIIKRLPTPDPEQYELVQAGNEKQFTSPMYVFI